MLEARAQFTVARSARLPSVDAPGQLQQSADRAEWQHPFAAEHSADTDYTGLTVSLGWELDLWGRIRNASAAARADLLASEQARRAVLQTLVSEVAGAYFLLRDLDLELEITGRALKLREDSLELVRLRVDQRLFLRDRSPRKPKCS